MEWGDVCSISRLNGMRRSISSCSLLIFSNLYSVKAWCDPISYFSIIILQLYQRQLHPSPKEQSIAKWHYFLDQFPSVKSFYILFPACFWSICNFCAHASVIITNGITSLVLENVYCSYVYVIHISMRWLLVCKTVLSSFCFSTVLFMEAAPKCTSSEYTCSTYTACVVLHGICHIVLKNRIVVCSLPQLYVIIPLNLKKTYIPLYYYYYMRLYIDKCIS